MNIGSKIRQIRTTKDITQEELAKLTGLSQKTISNIEIDKSMPSTRSLTKIADALGVSMKEITGTKEEAYKMNFLLELIMNLYDNKLITSKEVPEQMQNLIIEALKSQLKAMEKDK